MPPKYYMKKQHFAIKQGKMNVAQKKMSLEKQADGTVLMTIQMTIIPDQLADDNQDETQINDAHIPCGVFKFTGNKLLPSLFTDPAVSGDDVSNTVSILGDPFTIVTDGEKREHGSQLHPFMDKHEQVLDCAGLKDKK